MRSGRDAEVSFERPPIWTMGELTLRRDETTGRIVPASNSEEVAKAYTELKGVRFSEKLTTTSWGKYTILSDPDGNEFEIS